MGLFDHINYSDLYIELMIETISQKSSLNIYLIIVWKTIPRDSIWTFVKIVKMIPLTVDSKMLIGQ